MDKIGLTDEYLLKECLKPGLTAKETKIIHSQGIVMGKEEVVAWGPRRDFLDMACKLKGLYVTRDGDGANGESERNRPGGNSLSLVFTNEGAAREFVEAIASRRSGGGFTGVDAEVDPNLG